MSVSSLLHSAIFHCVLVVFCTLRCKWKIKSYHLILNKKHLKMIWDSNLLSAKDTYPAKTNMFMHNFGRQFHVAESLN